MLNNDDRQAIQGLFSRLREVERRAPPRDQGAEELIQAQIVRQPGAPYYMAQTILVQEHALELAERRIRELEDELERGGKRSASWEPERQRQRGPWDRGTRDDRGGGFLAGAAQTALGVTGGILIGNAIASLFGADAAIAAEPQPPSIPEQDLAPEAEADAGDDFGDFDIGGDF